MITYHCIACKRVYTELPPPNTEAEHVCIVCRRALPQGDSSTIPQPIPKPPEPHFPRRLARARRVS